MQNNLNRLLPPQRLGSSRFSGRQWGREEGKQREKQVGVGEKREKGGGTQGGKGARRQEKEHLGILALTSNPQI